MRIAGNDFVGHVLNTSIIIIAYTCLGRLVFGGLALSYSSIGRTLITLMFFILGEPDYPVFIAINEFIGRLFFLSFMVLSQYVLINFFIAILREALEMSRYMPFYKEKAIAHYMMNATLMYFNLTARNKRPGAVLAD